MDHREAAIQAITADISYRMELANAWRSVRYAEAYQRLHPEAESAVLPVSGGYAVFVGKGLPLNNARGLGLSGPVNEDDIQAVEEFYTSRGVTACFHVSPLGDDTLLEILCDRGYRLWGFFSVLARSIPEGFEPGPLPPDITIRQAQPEDADLWINITGRGFESRSEPDEDPSPEAVRLLGPNFHAEDAVPYLAWITDPVSGHQPAGGGGMYVHQGVVELGGASTLPRYRRRGVQRALIDARLARARQMDCDLAVVLTEPGSDSQRNMERAGFSLAYTKAVLISTIS